MPRRKTLWAAIAIAGTVAIASVAAVAQGDLPNLSQDDDTTLRAFDGERTSADALPALAATELEAIAPAGTRASESVKAVTEGDAAVFLTPAPGGVCLSLLEPGGATVNCVPDDAVRTGAARPSWMLTECKSAPPRLREPNTVSPDWPKCTGDIVLYGVVSDRTTAVTVEVEHGREAPATLANNAYLVRVPLEQGPTAVRAAGDGIDVVQLVRHGGVTR